jgi:hypothetical protein
MIVNGEKGVIFVSAVFLFHGLVTCNLSCYLFGTVRVYNSILPSTSTFFELVVPGYADSVALNSNFAAVGSMNYVNPSNQGGLSMSCHLDCIVPDSDHVGITIFSVAI